MSQPSSRAVRHPISRVVAGMLECREEPARVVLGPIRRPRVATLLLVAGVPAVVAGALIWVVARSGQLQPWHVAIAAVAFAGAALGPGLV